MFNNIFEILTVASDISEFISLKKTFDNHDQLQIINRLDKQDDVIYGSLLNNQNIIIKLLGDLSMEIKRMMDKIIDNNKKEDMEDLGDIFVDMVYMLKHSDKEKYKDIKYKMYKMAYGDHLNEELAHKWVSEMQNKDGTVGEHWTYEQTEQVRKQYAPELNACDFYAILNMSYSDFYSEHFKTEDYISLTKDWLNDKDGSSCKALKYYIFVVK